MVHGLSEFVPWQVMTTGCGCYQRLLVTYRMHLGHVWHASTRTSSVCSILTRFAGLKIKFSTFRKMYVVPNVPGCPWDGQGDVAGERTWLLHRTQVSVP